MTRPMLDGPTPSNHTDAILALRHAAAYLNGGGEWTRLLRLYVDDWLDLLCLLRNP